MKVSSRRDDFDDDEDYQPAGGGSIWPTLQRLLQALIVLAIVVFVICSFLPELEKQRVARQKEEELKVMVAQRLAAKQRKERELYWLKNDPGYVEMIARDRLDMKKDGETIYRIEVQKSATPPASSSSPAPRATPAPRG